MSNQSNDNQTRNRATQLFDDSVDSIDSETLSKITQARYRALEQKNIKSRNLLLPAGVIATACLLAIVVMISPGTVEETELQELDMDLISSSEDLEFYEELEFYEWLEGNELPS